MKILSPSGQPITSLADWETLGGPVSPDQWVPGRSAYELAAHWIERDAERHVRGLLTLVDDFVGLTFTEGVAEKETQFDGNARGPRHHDLLVRGVIPAGPVTVGVEGKADESFGDPLWLHREKALKSSPNTGTLMRTDVLCKRWFGVRPHNDTARPGLALLGYQLLSALAGTLADARSDDSVLAAVLVQEFVTDKTADDKHDLNARAYDEFLDRLLAGKQHRIDGSGGSWITRPVLVPGDGTWMRSMPVSFAKLRVPLREG